MCIKHHRVYFLECEGFIKIGSTTRPVRDRITDMQTGNPFPIEGIGVIECDCPRKANRPSAKCQEEERIQLMFKSLNINNGSRCEWYRGCDELRAYIEKNAESYTPYPVYDPPIQL